MEPYRGREYSVGSIRWPQVACIVLGRRRFETHQQNYCILSIGAAKLRTYNAEARSAKREGSQTVVPVNRPEDVARRRRVALTSQKPVRSEELQSMREG